MSHNSGTPIKTSSTTGKTLYERYPVNSILSLTLNGSDKPVRGVVYCTDEISQTVVLKKALTHTTLSSEIFVVQANAITSSQIIGKETSEDQKLVLSGSVNKKAIEQQEKRAIRLAEEALQHINQKVNVSSFGFGSTGRLPFYVKAHSFIFFFITK
jgi:hypothetical protein